MNQNHIPNQDCEPTEKQMLNLLGRKATLWSDLREYLVNHYPECVPVFSVEGKSRDYTIRYRKSGKTLVTLYPASKSLTVLVVLGKKEVAKVEAFESKLSDKTRELFRKTNQLHDGRWLWINPTSKTDLESIKMLLNAKRRPKRPSLSDVTICL